MWNLTALPVFRCVLFSIEFAAWVNVVIFPVMLPATTLPGAPVNHKWCHYRHCISSTSAIQTEKGVVEQSEEEEEQHHPPSSESSERRRRRRFRQSSKNRCLNSDAREGGGGGGDPLSPRPPLASRSRVCALSAKMSPTYVYRVARSRGALRLA